MTHVPDPFNETEDAARSVDPDFADDSATNAPTPAPTDTDTPASDETGPAAETLTRTDADTPNDADTPAPDATGPAAETPTPTDTDTLAPDETVSAPSDDADLATAGEPETPADEPSNWRAALDESIPDEHLMQAASDTDPTTNDYGRSSDTDPTTGPTTGRDPADTDGHAPLAAAVPSNGPYRRLYRSRADRKVGGVAAGLAQYFGLDPTLVRIGFAIFAITGVSLLIYLVCWVVVPKHPADIDEVVWQSSLGTDRTAALAVAAGTLGFAIAWLSSSWTLLAIVLILGGLWLLSDQPGQAAASSPDASQASLVPVPAGGVGSRQTVDAHPLQPSPARAYQPAPVVAKRRGPQRITRLVIAGLALLAGTAAAASAGDWWQVSPLRILGIAVVIIGVGIVAGALSDWGARGLIPLGLLGVLLLVPVAVVDTVVADGVGEVRFRPTTSGELLSDYRHGAGEMLVDLRNLDLDGVDRSVDIELGFGELIVWIPSEMGGTALVEATAGEINLDFDSVGNDRQIDGINIESGALTLPGERGSLDLNISVGFGVVELRTR